jgi:hypothetical protein
MIGSVKSRVGHVQDHINGATNWNIYGVQPCRIREWDVIFRVGKEVDLVNVERM